MKYYIANRFFTREIIRVDKKKQKTIHVCINMANWRVQPDFEIDTRDTDFLNKKVYDYIQEVTQQEAQYEYKKFIKKRGYKIPSNIWKTPPGKAQKRRG